jgi:hypothetical protein
MLPAGRIQAVPFSDVSECAFCGQRPQGFNPELEEGPGVSFVSFDVSGGGDDEIPAGLIETMSDRPGRRAYTAKDSFGRGATTVVVEKPMACSDCIRQAAELVGLGDTLPLHAALEDADAELAATRERLDAALRRAEQAEETLRQTAVFERLMGAAEPPKRSAKKAA